MSPSRTVWFHGVGLGSGRGLAIAGPMFVSKAGVRSGVPVGKVVLAGSKVSAAVGAAGGSLHPPARLAASNTHIYGLVGVNLAGDIALLTFSSR